MNQPLGPALGTACEVRAALAVLDGAGDARLRQVSVALGVEALALRGRDRDEARQQLEGSLDDGRARSAWNRVVAAHGGDPDPSRLARPARTLGVRSGSDGRVLGIDGEALGWVAVDLGAGRRRLQDAVDHAAGVEVHVRTGCHVDRGDPLATLLVGERDVDVEALAARTAQAFEIGAGEAAARQLVVGTVDDLVD
jgi:thymidine phosphorylase